MLDILAIVSPIYIILFLGYATTRAGLFGKGELLTFGKFVIKLALPALVFNAIAQRHIADIIVPGYLLAYTAGALAMLGGAYAVGRKAAGLSHQQALLHAMGMCSSNSSFIGYPILLLALPSVATTSLALNVVVENVVMLPLLLVLLETSVKQAGADQRGWRRALTATLRQLARNPLVVALLAGLAVSLLELPLPSPLGRSITMFAQTSGALAVFVIGGTLVGLPMRGVALKVAPIALGKLVMHPLAVALAVASLPLVGMAPLAPELRNAAILMAAMPMMSIYPILALPYGFADRGAAALVLATVGSFATLSALLWLLGSLA
ncbi:permease [Massilia sp. Root351]|jgi:predicted permease|uniref:AEC family transporter n=1 Tax=Massilia sp. Root351 TaxID=1736522 RepID=UPI00070C94D6|nr:AEC family transporter [Massilia sp. Root351]KQV90277.1 permease [Massilia sp. Root351]